MTTKNKQITVTQQAPVKKAPMDVKNKSWGNRHRAGVTKSK